MAEPGTCPSGGRHPACRRAGRLLPAGWTRILLAAYVLGGSLVAGPALAGIATMSGGPAEASRASLAALAVEAQEVLRDRLVHRHARLARDATAAEAAARGAELRLRRLAAELGQLERERAATATLVERRAAEVGLRQERLEALLAEIVQLSRDETGDPRRLAQLRAVAAALAQPYAEARRALAQGRAVALAQEKRVAVLREASVEARQALVDATARRAWLAADLERTAAAGSEAAGRLAAARRLAAAAAERAAHAAAGRELVALTMAGALAAPAAIAGPVTSLRRIAAPALTARAVVLARAARPPAPFDLSVPVPLAQGAPDGRQVMPVAGAVVGRFGDGQKPPFDQGLTIEVTDRRLVRAPRDGRVVFARDYEGFGLLLIIDHGNEYHSLLSGLSRFVVHEGWAVRAGQMVGTLEPGSEAVGRLYVELRRRGVPVDPLAWFAAGQDKVRS